MTVNLNSVAGALVGFLVIGDGATFTATSTSGDWPADTRLRVVNASAVETAFTPVIAATLATWTLTIAEVAALIGTKTGGQLKARVTQGVTDAMRGILAGELTILTEWVGVKGTQSLGTVVVGPAGPTAVSADVGNVASLGTDGLIYVAPAAPATRGLIITDTNVATIPAGSAVDNLAAYYNSGPSSITVAGVELTAGSHAVWAWVAGSWVASGTGTGTTGPTPLAGQPQGVAITGIGQTSATVTWQAGAPAAAGYVVRLNGGAWTDVGASLTRSLSGLILDTSYTVEVGGYMEVGGALGGLASATFRTASNVQATVIDTFTEAPGTALTAYASPVGLTWLSPTKITQVGAASTAGLGSIWMQAAGASNYTATTGGGGYILAQGKDLRITVGYIFPRDEGQVRLFGRGGIMMIFKANGGLSVDGAYAQSFPYYGSVKAVGVMSLQIIGSTVTAFWDGTQVATYEVSTDTDQSWGFTAYAGALVTDAKIEAATVSSPAPSLTQSKASLPVGTVIGSETWARADSTSIPWTRTNDALGGSSPMWWFGTTNMGISGGKLVKQGATFGGVTLYPGLENYSITATVSTLPTAGYVRIYGRSRAANMAEGLFITVTSSDATPGAFGTNYGASNWTGASFGTPQPGDKYTVKIIGDLVTFSAARSNGTAFGTPQTITHGYWAPYWLQAGIFGGASSAGFAVGDVVVTAE